MRYTIPLSYNPIDIPKLVEVLSRYEGMHHNQIVTDFEEEFKRATGASHTVALSSGTAAIHLALKINGVGPEDVVLVPTFTYVATVNPLLYLGAKPVFIDSEPETWNMDPTLVEKAIKKLTGEGKKPKAIVVVHTYGMPSRMAEILQLADDHDIPVIEDAAESIGSTLHGNKVGTMGRVGIYSFNNNKMITTYGGGGLVTRDSQLASKARFLAAQSRENLPYYEHIEVGYNYAMSPLNAACGLSQFPDINKNIAARREIFEVYANNLAAHGVEFPNEPEGFYSNRWLSTAVFKNKATRLQVSSVLDANHIETRPLWKPMHLQPLYKKLERYLSGVAENLFEKGLCLPSGHNTNREEIQLITSIIKEELRKVTI